MSAVPQLVMGLLGLSRGALKGLASFVKSKSTAGETVYRTMSKKDYEILKKSGKMPATKETFVSPTRTFSEDYDGVLVEFTLKPGTLKALQAIGVRDTSLLTRAAFPSMPKVSRGWTSQNAFFKGEGDQINIGLGRGKALDLFNDSILDLK